MLLVCATCHLYLKMHERTGWITSHIHRKLRFYSPHQKNINTANPHVPLSTDGVKKHSVLTMALCRYQFHLNDAWRRSRVILFPSIIFFCIQIHCSYAEVVKKMTWDKMCSVIATFVLSPSFVRPVVIYHPSFSVV